MNDRCRFVSLFSVGILTLGLLAAGLTLAASIPAWLDDAISNWNQENPETPIQFLDIKDSYVWYTMPSTAEIGHAEIRERVYAIVEAHGYQKTVEEELVTTGRPPSPSGPSKTKKCWSRSFTLDIDVGRQRMLTALVCGDTTGYYAGFRILQ